MHQSKGHIASRRQFLGRAATLGAGSLFYQVPGLFAQELTRTPQQTEGPYYPNRLPLDTDNDLLVINDNLTPAVGDIIELSGRVLTPAGSPVRNAEVEIWQADHTGAYIHSSSAGYSNRDLNFQGYGRFETASTGEYRFRTIKPALYEGRTRHIHIKVTASGQPTLTSQLYFADEPANRGDNIWGRLDPTERAAVTADLFPIADSTVDAAAMTIDVVLGEEARSGRPGRGRFGRR
jgi:protocatechuate 3,4-dioxygenase beta subunit